MRRAALALLALGAIWIAGLLAVDDVAALLGLLPAFVLLLPLVAGRYPLEGTLERLRPHRRPRLRAPLVLFAPAGRPLLDPGQRVGANQLHVYLFDAKTGAQFAGTKELRVAAALPAKGIGPLQATMRKAGPGHYVADTLQLVPGGDWKLTVHDRVSAFDEYTATLKVPVR